MNWGIGERYMIDERALCFNDSCDYFLTLIPPDEVKVDHDDISAIMNKSVNFIFVVKTHCAVK